MGKRPVPEGIRITKVGLWYVLVAVLVSIAATNTGNNALYLVVAVMLGLLVVSGVTSRHNLRGLEVAFETPGEVFANQPFAIPLSVRNRSRFLPRWLLMLEVSGAGQPLLVPFLAGQATGTGSLDLLLRRRGRHRLDAAHVSSLFPLGFFRKGLRYPMGRELLVFPEIYAAGVPRLGESGRWGDDPARQAGWGHELHALRAFRPGDDPRSIHWKQTARTGTRIFMERQVEESRRLVIVLDNAVGELPGTAEARFEHLVSEAATAAVDCLQRGFEVELLTRDALLPFASGPRQRWAVLEALAMVEARPRARQPLSSSDPRAAELRLSMEPEGPAG